MNLEQTSTAIGQLLRLYIGTRTLCFLKFLLCYALIPNTKPIYAQLFVPIMLSEITLRFMYCAIINNYNNMIFNSDTALKESSSSDSSESSPDSTNDSVLRIDELRLLLEKIAD